jgi:hypothetical protein
VFGETGLYVPRRVMYSAIKCANMFCRKLKFKLNIEVPVCRIGRTFYKERSNHVYVTLSAEVIDKPRDSLTSIAHARPILLIVDVLDRRLPTNHPVASDELHRLEQR